MRSSMWPSRRSGRTGPVGRALVAAVMVAVVAAPPALAAEAAEGARAEPATAPVAQRAGSGVAWEPCYEDFGPFECGYARVPLDYDRPRGTRIDIAMVRLPATDPDTRIGSIFFNPGGPGGSGVDFILGAGPFLYTDEVRARFDLIGFDPRGISRSTQLQCFDTLDEAFSILTPFAFPVTRVEERAWFASDRALASACETNGGDIQDHMSTANVARDLDRMRALVGDRTLTYAGYSYGSFLGTVYANMYPNRVRAVVVDGVLDPIAWTTGRGNEGSRIPFATRLRSDLGARDTLEEFFRLCDESGPQGCALAPGAADRYADLAESLKREPIEIVVDPETGATFTVGYADLIGQTLGALYSSFGWTDLAAAIAGLEFLAADQPVPVELSAPLMGMAVDDPQEYVNVLEGFPGVACADSDNPSRTAAWSAAARNPRLADEYFGRLWTMISSTCAVWPGEDADRYIGPFDKRTRNPVLVVGTRYDPATRYEGAEIVADLLHNSALLTVEGWGHTSLFLSACADQAVADYLLTGVPPADGTVCTQDIAPFPQSMVSARSIGPDRAEMRQAAMDEIGFPFQG
jgi:pimeloyl-ACP methyl ester carboxylesterase